MSGETEKEILQILEEAIKREKAAQNLYGKGVALAKNQEVKSIFERLQEEELQHEVLLREFYYNYKKRLGMKILQTDNPSDK